MSNAVIRMIETKDFEDIHNLNNELGYTYDKEKVYKKIISLLEAGNDMDLSLFSLDDLDDGDFTLEVLDALAVFIEDTDE